MNKIWSLALVSSFSLFAASPQNPPSPEIVEEQLEDAEAEFQRAKKMFNPWYTGPLLAPSAHILPPGMFVIEPYFFITKNYAQFDEQGHAHRIPHLNQLNPLFIMQIGILNWMDAVISTQGLRNQQSGHSSTNWGDSSASLGFGLLSEGPYRPALLLSVKESLPTGKYQHLNPKKNGVDATGSGAYQTTLGLNISKLIWWVATHPMVFRLAQSWSLPAMVSVKELNSYGGGEDTHGKVRLGHSYSVDLGYEFSFTQRWVLALDFVYAYSQKTTFSGHKGYSAAGTPNVIGGPFRDEISLAPALEYNVNEYLGFIGGVWFSVWGRNSLDFVSGVFSFDYAF